VTADARRLAAGENPVGYPGRRDTPEYEAGGVDPYSGVPLWSDVKPVEPCDKAEGGKEQQVGPPSPYCHFLPVIFSPPPSPPSPLGPA
jgi:hypothetical protein